MGYLKVASRHARPGSLLEFFRCQVYSRGLKKWYVFCPVIILLTTKKLIFSRVLRPVQNNCKP